MTSESEDVPNRLYPVCEMMKLYAECKNNKSYAWWDSNEIAQFMERQEVFVDDRTAYSEEDCRFCIQKKTK